MKSPSHPDRAHPSLRAVPHSKFEVQRSGFDVPAPSSPLQFLLSAFCFLTRSPRAVPAATTRGLPAPRSPLRADLLPATIIQTMTPDRFSRHLFPDHEVLELQGYLELGMRPQSLGVARRILNHSALTASAFREAVEAILIQAGNLKRWRPRIEDAYQRLSHADCKQVRFTMLSYFVAAEDWHAAEYHLPRKSANPAELLFAMWTCVELGRDQVARRFYRQCLRRLDVRPDASKSPDEFEMELSSLIEAVACYHARKGNWNEASSWWWKGTRLRPLTSNAWDGLVKLQTLEAISITKRAAESSEEGDWSFVSDSPLLFPAKHGKSVQKDEARRFRVYDRQLSRVVPVAERYRLGAALL